MRVGERNECKNFRGISLLSMMGKIYTGILVERVHRVTRGFRDGRGYVDQILWI